MSAPQRAVRSAPTPPAPTGRQGWWSRAAMAAFPPVMRLLGYTFQVGRSAALSAHAEAILEPSWGYLDSSSPVHRRYLDAPTWIIGYHRGEPIACMGLYDVREVSFVLNHFRAAPPPGLDPDTCRELSRLAITPRARGGARIVMIGLLREMYLWCHQRGITHLLTCSATSLFETFKRYNHSACLIDLPPAVVPAEVRAYHAPIYTRIPEAVTYTFDLQAFDALDVMLRTFTRPLRRRLRR